MCRGVDFWTEQKLFSDNKAKDFSGPKVKQFSLFVKTIATNLKLELVVELEEEA